MPLTVRAFARDGGYRGDFSGLIDEVKICNRAFSADEIKARYDAGSSGL